jgi:hypothetical protein
VKAGYGFALRADPRMAANAGQASAFLNQVAAVRSFLGPVADNPRRAPEYTLAIGEGDLQRVERWIYGQPVMLASMKEDSLGIIAERTVTGGWTAIRALGVGGEFERVRVFNPDTKQELLLPEFPVVAPEIAGMSAPPAAPRPAARPATRPATRRTRS